MSNLPQVLRKNQTTLAKTASYYVIHMVVAAVVAYAVTGDLMAAMALSLLEPTVQAVAYFMHEKAWGRAVNVRYRMLVKTGTYYVMHLVVAVGVAFAVTGDLRVAAVLSLLEPTVQMVFFYFHEKLWEMKAKRQAKTQVAPFLSCCASVKKPDLQSCD